MYDSFDLSLYLSIYLSIIDVYINLFITSLILLISKAYLSDSQVSGIIARNTFDRIHKLIIQITCNTI